MNDRPHTEKHGRKTSRSEVDGSDARVTFSPSVLEAMQDLHARALAHGPEKFDGDAALILRDMACGKPLSVEQTLSSLASVSMEAGQCYAKTGDNNVYEAANNIRLALNSMDGNSRPVTVTIEPKSKGRGD